MTDESRKRYQFKRLLDDLADKRGRGTELISVYVTPDFDLTKVVQQLRDEQGTASNIKSKTTKKNVVGALERVIQFLRAYTAKHRYPPEHGMAIFCGNVAGREDISDIQLYWIEPPEPTTVRMYRCDQEFVLQPLREMLQVKDTIGLVTLDRREATLATLRGKHIEILRKLTSGVPGKHGKGGQSARRFERLIEIAANEYMKRIAEAMNETFSQMPNLKAVIVGGPGPTKEEFVKSEVLHENIKKKISAVLDIGYTDEYGIRELVEKSSEVLKDLEIMKEKALMLRFMTELVAGKELSIYGERHIREMLEKGAVDLLLISEDLRRVRGLVRCQSCGHEFQETIEDINTFKKQLVGRSCPKCGEIKLTLGETKDLVQELCDLADRFNTRVEFISSETDEGKQLLIAFKGIAALLRFA